METAIVTITCPSCGGKVEGIRTTSTEQTIPCSYCKTELHVPRVGETIVRETKVVHEVRTVVAPEPEPVFEPLRRPPRPILPAFVAAAAGALVLLLFLAGQRRDGDDVIDKYHRERAQRDSCEASCKAQCANPPRRDTASTSTGDPKFDEDLAKTLRDSDMFMCTHECEEKADCFGLNQLH